VGGQLLAVLFVEERLVVKQFLLCRPAALEQVDDALRPGPEVGGRKGAAWRPGGQVARQQSAKRQPAEAEAGPGQKVSPRHGERIKGCLRFHHSDPRQREASSSFFDFSSHPRTAGVAP
jgi:hypothetical protein